MKLVSMIVLCENNEGNTILEYVGNEYYKCLYLYINLLKYGCQSDYTRVWKVLDDKRAISLVALSYHSALHLFSKEMNFDHQELVDLVKEIKPSIICASADIIRIMDPLLKDLGFMAEYGHIGKHVHDKQFCSDYSVQKAGLDDVREIAQLLYDDDDIGASYNFEDLVAQMRERLGDGYVRSYVIKDNDRIVAHLGTGAEIEKLCTISYVITADEYRGRGMSSALFAFACERLRAEGKEIYSVYYPENSRRLHHKNGFEDCCEFGKLYKNIQ